MNFLLRNCVLVNKKVNILNDNSEFERIDILIKY